MINYPYFCCPLDQKGLQKDQKRFFCEDGHSYDIAKEGYLHLLLAQHKKSKSPGDSKAMINARRGFLQAGHYDPIAKQLIALIQSYGSNDQSINILDAGCGEGYYLNYIQQANPQNQYIGVDISKPAIVAAAKKYPKINWIVASNALLPIKPQKIDLILCLFGFITEKSFEKTLASRGHIITVDPAENHLIELREIIYPNIRPYQKIYPLDQASAFVKKDTVNLNYKIELNQEAITQLTLMTPHFFRATASKKEQLLKRMHLEVTVDVCLNVYLKN